MNPVVHFEMPAEDKQRMSDFYTKVFGWETKMLGPDMGEYVMVMTTPEDKKTHRPKEPGAINGGFYQKEKGKPDMYPSVVIAVNNADSYMKKITQAGGKILGKPMDIPHVGIYVSFRDTEGNRVTILQPSPDMSSMPG